MTNDPVASKYLQNKRRTYHYIFLHIFFSIYDFITSFSKLRCFNDINFFEFLRNFITILIYNYQCNSNIKLE